jgi:hypothetical protein
MRRTVRKPRPEVSPEMAKGHDEWKREFPQANEANHDGHGSEYIREIREIRGYPIPPRWNVASHVVSEFHHEANDTELVDNACMFEFLATTACPTRAPR